MYHTLRCFILFTTKTLIDYFFIRLLLRGMLLILNKVINYVNFKLIIYNFMIEKNENRRGDKVKV